MEPIKILLKRVMILLIIHHINQKALKDLDQNGKRSILGLYCRIASMKRKKT